MENEFDLENISQKIDMVNQKLAQLESKSLEIEKRQDVIDSLAYAYLFRAEMVLSKVNTVKEIEILQQLHVSIYFKISLIQFQFIFNLFEIFRKKFKMKRD